MIDTETISRPVVHTEDDLLAVLEDCTVIIALKSEIIETITRRETSFICVGGILTFHGVPVRVYSDSETLVHAVIVAEDEGLKPILFFED